jgi:hypothetical protein
MQGKATWQPMKIDFELRAADLVPAIHHMWEVSGQKLELLERTWDPREGAPVFTRQGRYASRGWTEWTQGFVYGSALLQYDATGAPELLTRARRAIFERMPAHVTHMGVHDHGFNIVSTYGNLWRMMGEKRIPEHRRERQLLELALRASAAVQARRWTPLPQGGFIHSFNGPHSLFADTMRSLRSLALGHLLGQVLKEEQDREVSLLTRLVEHAETTARYSVYYGQGRDIYDEPGRVAHESLFNPVSRTYRCPGTQQGYSPFSTWTRGLAWVMLGFAEQIEFLDSLRGEEAAVVGAARKTFAEAADATCEFYLRNTPADGIPYWDTGAPNLGKIGQYLKRNADPFNDHEPVDSSAAAIAAQGLLRFGRTLVRDGRSDDGRRFVQAGLTITRTLLGKPYLCADPDHQGLLLHSVYHRPNGWDYVPPGRKTPCGESSMWGDYHLRELCLYLQRLAEGGIYHAFFGPVGEA